MVPKLILSALLLFLLIPSAGCESTPPKIPSPEFPLRQKPEFPLKMGILRFSPPPYREYFEGLNIAHFESRMSQDHFKALKESNRVEIVEFIETPPYPGIIERELEYLRDRGFAGVFKGTINSLKFSGGPQLWSFLPPFFLLWGLAALGPPTGPAWFNIQADLYVELIATTEERFGRQEWRSNLKVELGKTRLGVTWSTPMEKLHTLFLDKIAYELRKAIEKIPPPVFEKLLPPPPRPPDGAWALIVGISEYENAHQKNLSSLPYCDDDAEAFKDTLLMLGWKGDHIKVLKDKEATFPKVRDALVSWLRRAGEGDLIVLYWAGHGIQAAEKNEKFYFACHDTPPDQFWLGYPMDQVRREIQDRNPRNVIILADTCHAGGVIPADVTARGAPTPRPDFEWLPEIRQIPQGWVYMVAAERGKKARSVQKLNHGIFTHCLLKALQGEADGYRDEREKDGRVTLGEIREYLFKEMPKICVKNQLPERQPEIRASTKNLKIWDLDLCFPKDSQKAK